MHGVGLECGGKGQVELRVHEQIGHSGNYQVRIVHAFESIEPQGGSFDVHCTERQTVDDRPAMAVEPYDSNSTRRSIVVLVDNIHDHSEPLKHEPVPGGDGAPSWRCARWDDFSRNFPVLLRSFPSPFWI
jgi:hypothetical protein